MGLINPDGGADLQKAWRAARSLPSFYALLAANLLPLIGIAFLHWRADALILFYIVECVVTYFVTAKMLAFVAEDRELPERLAGRFLTGAGLCILMVGAFWTFFLSGSGLRVERADAASILAFVLSAAFVAASHVYSYFHDFIGRKEHERLPVGAIEARWGRTFAGLVVVTLISPLLFAFRSPAAFASVLVVIKTLVALSAFVEERARAEGSKATSITYTRPTARCPRCHQLLRTDHAKQCFHCGADWHQSAA